MNIGELIDHYQEWVDYDMKRYGKVSNETNRDIEEAGLQIVKDKYGDYEVIAGKYNESLKGENGWVKRWSSLDKYYKGDLVISKISSPYEAWHIEKVAPNGRTIKHLSNYKSLKAAMDAAEQYLIKNESKSIKSKESVDKSLKEPLSELATHCVYFTQDGIEQIEFEGSEDECNQYIADIQAEQDDEFGNEAPERFIKRLHEKMFILGESISPEYKMVEYTYDGDELSDYLGHVRVRTDSDKVALHAAEEYVMNKQFERNPRHFKICNDSYNNVDVIDSYGDFLTRLESVTESESYEDMYKYVVEYTFYNVKKSVIYDKRHGHDYAETPEDAEALFQKYVKMAEARGYDSIFVKIARPIFLGTSLIDSDAIKIYSDGEIIKDNMIDESLKEAKKLRAPKFWNTRFADNVIKDYEAGKLTFDNIEEWDTAYNDGRKPNPPFNTKEILDYYLATKDTPTESAVKESVTFSDYMLDKNSVLHLTSDLLKDYNTTTSTTFICPKDEYFLVELSVDDGQHLLQCPHCQTQYGYDEDDIEATFDIL